MGEKSFAQFQAELETDPDWIAYFDCQDRITAMGGAPAGHPIWNEFRALSARTLAKGTDNV